MLADNSERARFNMIAQQVRPVEVIDERVLDAMAQVPREDFVPEAYRGVAFADVIVPLAGGQAMMKPLQEARMLQALEVQPGDSVLEIGTGSGFVTACLARLGSDVTSYELDKELADAAAARLADQGVTNARVLHGDGLAAEAPEGGYAAIAVTGSLPCYDKRLDSLLAPGGRLFVVVGEAPVMEAMLVRRDQNGAIARENLFETEVPALRNAPRPDGFAF